MRLARRVALGLGSLLLVSVAVASPQPNPICGACGSSFENTVENDGPELNVTHSEAIVHIHRNGSATWQVRNRLTTGSIERLTNDTATITRIGRRAVTDNYGLPHVYEDGRVTVQSIRLDNETLVLQFRDPDAATRRLGVQVVDYLHSGGVRGGWRLTATNFSVVGPPETAVVNDPRAPFEDEYIEPHERPTVNGSRVTWEVFDADEYGPVIYEDVYIAYGPADTAQWPVDAALALATAPIWLDNVAGLFIPVAVLALVLVPTAAALIGRLSNSGTDPDIVAGVVGSLGLVGVLGAVLVPENPYVASLGGIAVVYLVTGSVGLTKPRLLGSVRGTLAVGIGNLLAVALFRTGYLAGVDQLQRPVIAVVKGTIPHLPVAFSPTFGRILVSSPDTDNVRAVVLTSLGVLATALLSVMAAVPYDHRPWILSFAVLFGGAVLAGSATFPLLVLVTHVVMTDPASRAEDA